MCPHLKKKLDLFRVRGKLKTELGWGHGEDAGPQPADGGVRDRVSETFALTPCEATCGLGRKTHPCPVARLRTDGVREFLELSTQRPASGGSWQNTQSIPGPRTKGLAGVLGTHPRVAGHNWTALCEDV